MCRIKWFKPFAYNEKISKSVQNDEFCVYLGGRVGIKYFYIEYSDV